MSTITISVDLAKSVFSVCEINGPGHVLKRQDLRREPFGLWLAQLPADTSGDNGSVQWAHHRRAVRHAISQELAHQDDRDDAEAIAMAARQGNMRFVPVKNIDQQVRLSWHRVREGYKAELLAIGNRLRGLLAEFGVIVAQRDLALRRQLADLDAQSGRVQGTGTGSGGSLVAARQDERCERLCAIVGVGAITADAALARQQVRPPRREPG